MYKGTNSVHLESSIGQSDTIYPKVLNQTLEDILKNWNREERGIKISGQNLNHLRYADGIVLLTDKKIEVKEVFEELDTEAKKIGLSMNCKKTKVMRNTDKNVSVTLGWNTIEQVNEHTYLGQLNKVNWRTEIRRDVKRVPFQKIRYILKCKKYPQCLTTKLFNQCILPVLNYSELVN